MSSTIPGRTRQIRVVGVPQRPGRPPQAPSRPPRVRRVRLGTDRGVQPDDVADLTAARPVPTEPVTERPAPALPDPTAMCCTVVRAAVEVLHGDRPAAQLARWLTPVVLDQLTERARLLREAAPSDTARTTRPVQVRRIRLERRGESAEATVVVEDRGRCRAAAVRLEAHRGQWRIAVLELG